MEKEKKVKENSRVCPVCGKTFIPAYQHIYRQKRKKTGKMVCSYSCSMKDAKM